MCAAPAKIPGRNSDPDPDGSVDHIFAESDQFNGDCNAGSAMKIRELDWDVFENWTDTDLGLLEPRDIAKRTRASQSKAWLTYCANNQVGQLVPQTYSGYRTVAGLANKGWISVGKPLVCGAVGVVVYAKQQSGVDYVTEHVFEKQSLRNILQFMASGKLPGGGTISIGKVPQGILDIGGVSTILDIYLDVPNN